MSIELTMPALSPTMEKGGLARWLVKEGDAVDVGDALAEVETDKATMEVEATEAGVITRLLVAEGAEDVPVGAVIALIGSGPAQPPTPAPVRTEAPAAAAAAARPPPKTQPQAPLDLPQGLKITPLARRIAELERIDLATVKGSGWGGKIVKADLKPPEIRPAATNAVASAAIYPPPAGVPHETIKLSGMRKTIARRLTEAKQTVPHFYLSVDVRLDALLKVRADFNGQGQAQAVKLSVNDFLIKALAGALQRTPDANVQFAGDRYHRFDRVDVSMAVAVPGGLVTPVIVDAGGKRLIEIAAEARRLGEQARAGKLAPEAYQGGTVSISNLGMFGVKAMIPVINPPQALILGIGAGEERACSVNGALISAMVMTVVGSFDHRVIDGAVAAAFLGAFKHLVEHPFEIVA